MAIESSVPTVRARSLLSNRSVGTRLTAMTVALVGAVFILALFLITYSSSRMVEQRSVEQMTNEVRSVSHMIEMFDHSVTSQVDRFSTMFGNDFTGGFTLDEARTIQIGERATPAFQNNGHDLNLDFTVPHH